MGIIFSILISISAPNGGAGANNGDTYNGIQTLPDGLVATPSLQWNSSGGAGFFFDALDNGSICFTGNGANIGMCFYNNGTRFDFWTGETAINSININTYNGGGGILLNDTTHGVPQLYLNGDGATLKLYGSGLNANSQFGGRKITPNTAQVRFEGFYQHNSIDMTFEGVTNSNFFRGGHAWARASTNTVGGNNFNGGGIGSTKIVCNDRTLADQDVLTFHFLAINSSGILTDDLVESTDFDCEGEASEEVCCDNLGTALDAWSYISNSDITTDCTTTAGTCYVTFNEYTNVGYFTITDGGVNGVFATITAGDTGDVYVYGKDVITERYDVDYVTEAGSATLGPTAPGWISNGSVGGLGFDPGGGETVYVSLEVPSCWDASTDLTLKIYWTPQTTDAIQLNETVIWDFDWRSINWGTEDTDNGTAESDTVTYTETANPGDENDTHISTMTLVVGSGNQTVAIGDVLTGALTRDNADTYSGEALFKHAEITVRQTSLKCDHH